MEKSELEKENQQLRQDLSEVSNDLEKATNKWRKLNAALFKIEKAETETNYVSVIIELTARIQDLLEANNRDVERRRVAEGKLLHISKFNGLINGPLFEGYLRMEKELASEREKHKKEKEEWLKEKKSIKQ